MMATQTITVNINGEAKSAEIRDLDEHEKTSNQSA